MGIGYITGKVTRRRCRYFWTSICVHLQRTIFS